MRTAATTGGRAKAKVTLAREKASAKVLMTGGKGKALMGLGARAKGDGVRPYRRGIR
jgi:hypothetical protein